MSNMGEIHQKLVKIRNDNSIKLKKSSFLNDHLPDGSMFNLRYYQNQAVVHLMVMNNFVLGDDTGLGKTIECIAALCHLWDKNPEQKVIIITTKSSSGQWVDEFKKFTSGVNVFFPNKGAKKREEVYTNFIENGGPSVLIINYSIAKLDYKYIQFWKSYILILDECSMVKNTSSQTHQTCKYLAMNSSKTWGVSATIIKNNLIEGYGIFKVVVPNVFKTKTAFIKDFCIVKMQRISNNRQIPIVVGYRKSDIERFREIIDPYFLGRPKHEVASELPVLTRKMINVPMGQKQGRIYKDALNGNLFINSEETEISKLTAIVYCQQIANHPSLISGGEDADSPKFDTLFDLLKEGDLEGEKVIIFSRFKKMVDLIMDRISVEFKQRDYAVRITGDENNDERKRSRDLFQDDESETKVICITTAGSEAINLQAAKAIIYYDTPWSAGDFLQILGRMIRIGSSHQNVYSIHLCSSDSIDEHVMNVLEKKMDLVEGVLGKKVLSDEDVIKDSNETSDLFNLLKFDSRRK